jgi:hypothetical protein
MLTKRFAVSSTRKRRSALRWNPARTRWCRKPALTLLEDRCVPSLVDCTVAPAMTALKAALATMPSWAATVTTVSPAAGAATS